MRELEIRDGGYASADEAPWPFAACYPSVDFYRRFVPLVFRSAALARAGVYDDEAWRLSSVEAVRMLEAVGVRVEVSGLEHLDEVDGPCVFIGNHMSMLETVVLPCLITPHKPVTFVVKESLVHYPVFKHVMRSRDPITVTRDNPRADMKAVMEGGRERLAAGRSIIIFPQTTRTTDFDSSQFNSIGVKLAQRAGVPIVPIALETHAWTNGVLLKDFGRIQPERHVRFAFGAPLTVQDRGAEEQRAIIEFIERHLASWRSGKG